MNTSTMDLNTLNQSDTGTFRDAMTRCCGSQAWAAGMEAYRPFADLDDVIRAADTVWQGLSAADWREAFTHHPKIGDVDSLRAKFATTRDWAQGEQAGVQDAKEETIQGLVRGNAAYEARFGYIYIVCATGKSAEEMLALLEARLRNLPEVELALAATEQAKITRIRLEKLLS